MRVPTFGRRLWTGTFWLMLLALAGLLVLGFSSGPILRQAVWSPLGLRRLALYACAYGGLVLACWRISWRLLTPLTIGAGGFLAATSFGFGPLAALVFYACSAVALGDAVFSALGDRREGASPAVRLPLVFLLGICVIVFGVGLAVHFPINYSSGYMLALLLPVVLNRKRLWLYGQEAARRLVGRAPRSGAAEFAARALLGFVVLAHFLVALKPEVSYDGLSIHLVAPAYVATHHRWPFDVSEFIWAVMPLGGDWAYTGIYLLGGEYAARLTNFLFLAAILGMLYCFARRWLRRPQALVAVSLFASTPLVQLLTGSLFVENTQAGMLVAALLALERLRATREPAWLVAAGVFLGTSLAIKFGSFPFVLPLAAVAAIQLARAPRGRRVGLQWTLLAGCSLLLTAAPPYAYAWWSTGNPVFPFLNEVFRSPLLASPVFVSPFSPTFNAVNVLERLTFHSHEFLESQDGALGFHYFLLVPLTAFLIGRRCWSRLGLAAVTAATASVVILLSQPYLRYLYAALPFWSVAICCTIGVAGLHGRALRQALIGASVVLVLLNVYFLPASGWYHRDFFAWSPLGRQDYERYEEALAPGRKLVDYLNLRHPSQPVWFIGGYHLAGLRGKAYFTSWHQYLFLAELGRCQRSEDVLKLAAKHGLRHFIVASDLAGVSQICGHNAVSAAGIGV